MKSRSYIIALLIFAPTSAHFALKTPKPRSPPLSGFNPKCKTGVWTETECLWYQFHQHYMFNEGCFPGLDACFDGPPSEDPADYAGLMHPTVVDEAERTYANETREWIFRRVSLSTDVFPSNPWRAPGYAPVSDSCGVFGGTPRGKSVGNGAAFVTWAGGERGTELSESEDQETWARGSVVEASFQIAANHGGGYQYRLCSANATKLDEECFQKLPLVPAGDTHIIEWGDDPSTRVEIPSTKVTGQTKVKPAGSIWLRNPIPACERPDGGSGGNPCVEPQFEAPLPDLFGFGVTSCVQPGGPNPTGEPDRDLINGCLSYGGLNPTANDASYDNVIKQFDFRVIDRLEVPVNIAAGKYVLSWRADSEQTPQVWTNCADVLIV